VLHESAIFIADSISSCILLYPLTETKKSGTNLAGGLCKCSAD
jgi:hypothetical protein